LRFVLIADAFLRGLPFGQPPFFAFSLAALAFAGVLVLPAWLAITGPMLKPQWGHLIMTRTLNRA